MGNHELENHYSKEQREQFVVHRMVVKIGSSTITKDGDPLNKSFMDNIARQSSQLFKSGVEVFIVSSGAVMSGDALIRKNGIDMNQLFSSHILSLTEEEQKVFLDMVKAFYGQTELMSAWREVFWHYGVLAGQGLYEDRNLRSRTTREVLESACKIGVPIINANDAVSDFEMRQLAISADNDKLAGFIARTINADTLVFLTDVDGVLDENGKELSYVDRLEDIQELIKDTGDRPGGMWGKTIVAKTAAREGRRTFITNGRKQNILIQIARGENLGTRFGKGWMLY